MPLGSGRVGSDDLGYGPGSGFSFEPVQTSSVCVCVCVCVSARAWRAPKQTNKVYFELRARPNDQIHTKHVKTAGLEIIHLNPVYVLK